MLHSDPPNRHTENRHVGPGRTCHHFQRFGLTCDEYDDLRKRADGRCEICRRAEAELSRPGLVIDHWECPDAFFIRGLICQRCNSVMARHDRSAEWGPASLPWADAAHSYHVNAWQRPDATTRNHVAECIALRRPSSNRVGQARRE